MSIYDDRPWLARYDAGQPTDLGVEHENALAMFQACVRLDPGAPMIRYFDGMITRRDLDEAASAFGAARSS
jgi:long-chain acyl-CoA synthetase